MPELSLNILGADAAFHPADVLLEKPPSHHQLHGEIGMDLPNAVQRVTLDLEAMRLTFEE